MSEVGWTPAMAPAGDIPRTTTGRLQRGHSHVSVGGSSGSSSDGADGCRSVPHVVSPPPRPAPPLVPLRQQARWLSRSALSFMSLQGATPGAGPSLPHQGPPSSGGGELEPGRPERAQWSDTDWSLAGQGGGGASSTAGRPRSVRLRDRYTISHRLTSV